MPRYKIVFEKTVDDLLKDLCDMVNNIIEKQAEKSLTMEQLRIEMRKGIMEVLKLDIGVSDSCGLSIACQEEELLPPWSEEEDRLKQEGI